MSDDNVRFLNFNSKTPVDMDTVDNFLDGVDSFNSYADSERAAKAVMHGIIRVASEKFGVETPGFYQDAAVISVLVLGMFARQRGLEIPEVHLLDSIRDGLNDVSENGEPK